MNETKYREFWRYKGEVFDEKPFSDNPRFREGLVEHFIEHAALAECQAKLDNAVSALRQASNHYCEKHCMPHEVVATSHTYECEDMRQALRGLDG